MHDERIRQRAVRFRAEENASIDEIATWLAVSRTTVYYWLRDHPIDRGARPVQSEARQRAGAAASARALAKREAAFAQGVAEWPSLSADPSFRDFVVLYIAEGSKRERSSVSTCNSDPAVLLVAQRWILRLARSPVTYSVQYHADQDVAELRAFWAEQLNIDPDDSPSTGRRTPGNGPVDDGRACTASRPCACTTRCFALGSKPGSRSCAAAG